MSAAAVLPPLTLPQLRAKVPAVFADHAHEDCSNRYGFASTTKVLTALESAGFVVVEANAYGKRNTEQAGFAKHLLRLRRAGDVKKQLTTVGDVVPQVVLLNSHDRTSPFKLYAGMFRMVCSNGLIVSDKNFVEPIVVRHTNNMIAEVMANVERIAADAGKVTDAIARMTECTLTDRQQRDFAKHALELRFGNGAGRGAVEPEALLDARRDADKGSDVWHVYNRVQENMMRGGIASVTATGRHTATKPITSVHTDVHVNAGLWELAMATIAKARTSAAKHAKK